MKKKTRQLLILNGLLILIVAAAILSVNSGYARIPFSAAVHSIFQPHMEGASVVVAQFRVPRIVLAVLCGMGLALAGCVMQTVTGNPLADPGILGINAGAGFAVMLFLTFFPALHIRTMAYQPIFAIAGGLCTTGLLYLFAKRNGKLLPIYFLLGGIGLASLFSSFMLIMAANMDNSSYQLVARWLAGNIWGTSWHQVLALLPYTIVMVLHDLNHAIMFSDYLVAIKDGILHSAGTPQEVITQQALREIFDIEAEVITHPVLNVPVCLPFRITEQNKKTGGSNT